MEEYNEIKKCIMKPSINHKISIAPMMGITNSHFRYLMRLLTKETVLYTEMIHHDAILNFKYGANKILEFNEIDHPVVLQLGGNDPLLLSKCSKIAYELGYDEINLNCGCPSNKVTAHNFGACLMNTPELVAECCLAMNEAVQYKIPITVKCRLGLNKEKEEFLENFLRIVSEKGGVNHFILHARIAIMNLDTDKNRKIPPLRYEKVIEMKKKFPHLNFSINGGIKTFEEAEELLNPEKGLMGVMIGRAAYDNPIIFSLVDNHFFGKENQSLTRREILRKYSEYGDRYLKENLQFLKKNKIFGELIAPLTFLFNGEKNNSLFKKMLVDKKEYEKNELFSTFLNNLVEKFEEKNKESLDKL